MKNVIKLLTALAAIAGIVYIIATYGEQIVAWAKKVLNAMPKCPFAEETHTVVEFAEEPAEEAAEEAVEEAEAPAPEVVIEETDPVAEEADFAE